MTSNWLYHYQLKLIIIAGCALAVAILCTSIILLNKQLTSQNENRYYDWSHPQSRLRVTLPVSSKVEYSQQTIPSSAGSDTSPIVIDTYSFQLISTQEQFLYIEMIDSEGPDSMRQNQESNATSAIPIVDASYICDNFGTRLYTTNRYGYEGILLYKIDDNHVDTTFESSQFSYIRAYINPNQIEIAKEILCSIQY